MKNRDPGRASSAPPRREGEERDWSVVVEDGRAKTSEPVSSAVAEPEATTLRHEPHEPPRQQLPTKLFEKRTKVHNKRIDGPFRRFKWFVMFVTLAIYYGTPWIRWDRGPYAPDQAVLVDLANRRFYMFGIEIWPHEFYYVAGLLIMAALGLFLVTSAVGRAWCGYACPQTVWTDLFQHVDRFVDGDRNARMRLDAAPMGPKKFAKRSFKYTIYLVISFWTGGAWIMYFADAPTLVQDFWVGDAAPAAYITVAILTLTTFTLGGFMREQVCIYMCPWPRIQTAMMDEKSLLVTYKDWRGEPRGSVKKAEKNPGKFGDCIDCLQCVAVCPTGIDIREGPQVGCITCGLCIDACDKVMADVGRPRGLIDYATLEDCEKEANGEPTRSPWRALLRPRTLAYFLIWGSIGFAMLFALGVRNHVGLSVSPDRNPPYILMSDGSVRNSYTLKLRNMESRPREMEIAVEGLPGALMWTDTIGRGDAARIQIKTVPADQVLSVRVYVVAPQGTSTQDFSFSVTSRDEQQETATTETRFDTPGGEE
ncbi:cytochrome c oxidase accessory protein CcoG [Erythrobacter sp. SAORIC-644]|jgi:cytochrome c oxidase accessory protein FixG|uniref:cytochrome c oxidase accessory protein CcoG n=1 Tax=Erythrobacter sp. SAORIC-644 TaxID=1869314 RepID=UPI000C96C511|nr:cytochrome c oxidase accessory protein CcoG [Erythrobacter sp. SAORIC-644]MAG42429.1 cytochrome c oxidase accessory protein CcoG [Erythrobacteraceae bacterium]PNQ77144.1 cytochrome c oxidase accessory protein CcoG [Erythrobacter sp. SAORIC-644]|tara:strand:- start:42 stop:1652 length:1611 start_codon:yes stop_codon:yes gene_type:complete